MRDPRLDKVRLAGAGFEPATFVFLQQRFDDTGVAITAFAKILSASAYPTLSAMPARRECGRGGVSGPFNLLESLDYGPILTRVQLGVHMGLEAADMRLEIKERAHSRAVKTTWASAMTHEVRSSKHRKRAMLEAL